MSDGERYRRMCPQHGRLLDDGLYCPVGGHHVEVWKVVDTEKHQVTSEAHIEQGEVTVLKEKLTPAPRKAARRVAEERQEPMEEREKTVPMTSSGPLKKASFNGARGQLVVRMLRRKSGTYQVSWALKPTTGKKAAGLLYQGDDRSQVYDAWEKALQEAKAQNWQERSAYVPIPSADSVEPLERRGRVKPTKAPKPRAQVDGKRARHCSKCGKEGHQKVTCGRKSKNSPSAKKAAQAA